MYLLPQIRQKMQNSEIGLDFKRFERMAYNVIFEK
jgi:hypothetical protein